MQSSRASKDAENPSPGLELYVILSWKGLKRITEPITGPAQDSLKNPTMACTINKTTPLCLFLG